MRQEISGMVDLLLKAHANKQLTPLVSQHYPELDVSAAYEVQRAYARRRLEHDRVGGLKAGLTSEANQKRMGMTAPVAAVLLASGRREGTPVIDRAAFQRTQVETEIGFVVGQPIGQSLPSLASLRERIAAIMPAIELPDLGFADRTKLTGRDLIAANGGAAQFIVGPQTPVRAVDEDRLTISLTFDGREINQWRGSLEDQWKAALWLTNTMIAQGWTLEPGQVLIAGSLGQDAPGEPGAYVADFGKLGRISFQIR
jgi:2-keto-4-pentenoate hydratase